MVETKRKTKVGVEPSLTSAAVEEHGASLWLPSAEAMVKMMVAGGLSSTSSVVQVHGTWPDEVVMR